MNFKGLLKILVSFSVFLSFNLAKGQDNFSEYSESVQEELDFKTKGANLDLIHALIQNNYVREKKRLETEFGEKGQRPLFPNIKLNEVVYLPVGAALSSQLGIGRLMPLLKDISFIKDVGDYELEQMRKKKWGMKSMFSNMVSGIKSLIVSNHEMDAYRPGLQYSPKVGGLVPVYNNGRAIFNKATPAEAVLIRGKVKETVREESAGRDILVERKQDYYIVLDGNHKLQRSLIHAVETMPVKVIMDLRGMELTDAVKYLEDHDHRNPGKRILYQNDERGEKIVDIKAYTGNTNSVEEAHNYFAPPHLLKDDPIRSLIALLTVKFDVSERGYLEIRNLKHPGTKVVVKLVGESAPFIEFILAKYIYKALDASDKERKKIGLPSREEVLKIFNTPVLKPGKNEINKLNLYQAGKLIRSILIKYRDAGEINEDTYKIRLIDNEMQRPKMSEPRAASDVIKNPKTATELLEVSQRVQDWVVLAQEIAPQLRAPDLNLELQWMAHIGEREKISDLYFESQFFEFLLEGEHNNPNKAQLLEKAIKNQNHRKVMSLISELVIDGAHGELEEMGVEPSAQQWSELVLKTYRSYRVLFSKELNLEAHVRAEEKSKKKAIRKKAIRKKAARRKLMTLAPQPPLSEIVDVFPIEECAKVLEGEALRVVN